ncbi:MAG: hypothetical protein ACJA2W_004117 [Planctomycetota bacterium]
MIARIRRVLERSGLNPLQLGLPPRPGDQEADASLDFSEHEQPLLDFGDARDGAFFPGLKSASVSSLDPFGPRAGLPLRRLRDPDLARAHQSCGWSGQRVSPLVVENLAAIVPHPREHQVTYQGVLAPASSLRDQVVPRPVIRKEPRDAGTVAADASGSPDERAKG